MIKIQVTNPNFTERKWNDKVTGLPRSMRIQTLLVYLVGSDGKTETYDKIDMILQDKQNPYSVGTYTLAPTNIYLDRNNRLQVGLTNLQPMQQKLQSAA